MYQSRLTEFWNCFDSHCITVLLLILCYTEVTETLYTDNNHISDYLRCLAYSDGLSWETFSSQYIGSLPSTTVTISLTTEHKDPYILTCRNAFVQPSIICWTRSFLPEFVLTTLLIARHEHSSWIFIRSRTKKLSRSSSSSVINNHIWGSFIKWNFITCNILH